MVVVHGLCFMWLVRSVIVEARFDKSTTILDSLGSHVHVLQLFTKGCAVI